MVKKYSRVRTLMSDVAKGRKDIERGSGKKREEK